MGLLLQPELDDALEIHSRTHRLMQWLESAIERGIIAPESADDLGTSASGMLGWLERYYDNIPPGTLAPRDRLPQQAAFLTTVLNGTFELDQRPGKALYSPDAHCFCPMCSWMVQRPHLRPKKPGPRDRNTAEAMRHKHLAQLAVDLRSDPSLIEPKKIDGDPYIRDDLAMCTYGADLMERMQGRCKGAAALVLWRLFAWTPEGSPKRNFRLTADKILDAQDRLLFRCGLAGPR